MTDPTQTSPQEPTTETVEDASLETRKLTSEIEETEATCFFRASLIKKSFGSALHEFISIYTTAFKSLLFIKLPQQATPLTPFRFAGFMLLNQLLYIGLQRFYIEGSAEFDASALHWGWWTGLITLWLCWMTSIQANKEGLHSSVSRLFAITLGQDLFIGGVNLLLTVYLIKLLPAQLGHLQFGLYIFTCLWGILAFTLLLTQACRAKPALQVGVGFITIALYVGVYYSNPPWYWYEQEEETAEQPPLLILSQSAFEKQQHVAEAARNALASERPGRSDLYTISFAPHADQVFLNESKMVNEVLEQHFDSAQRSQQLINHPNTLEEYPWATGENLARAINAVSDKMNRDEDILLIYLTSHGGKDGKLSAHHWPLTVDSISPSLLNMWLDKANIKYRIIIVSACYSGSWIAPLENENTLIMTAADATHTSYGCGYRSELTYFGRALFDEQLRKTRSFETAFKQAVPIIKQREIEGKKDDGFSNPQLVIGAAIKQKLEEFERQLN